MYLFSVIPESIEGGFNKTEFEYYLRNNLLSIFSPLFPDKLEDVVQAMYNFYAPYPHLEDEDLNREAFNTVISSYIPILFFEY